MADRIAFDGVDITSEVSLTTGIILLAVTTVLGILIGAVCAAIATGGPRWTRALVGGYVELIRNTPLLIQAYFLIFGVASLGFYAPANKEVVAHAYHKIQLDRAGKRMSSG